jgi:hypothetical protein
MANELQIHVATPAPQTISYGFDTTGAGANWDNTKYYAVHVTASYDPDDENIWLTGVENFGLNLSRSSALVAMEVLQDSVQPSNADDVLTVTWTAPPGPPPHHYNVFIQGPNAAQDTYQLNEYGNPMSDWSGSSEVTNDTFTFTITDPTDTQGSLVTAKIVTLSLGATDYFDIEGNHLMQFGYATPIIVDAAGANTSTTVAATALVYDSRGTLTRVYTADDISGAALGELVTYRDMRHTFQYNSSMSSGKDFYSFHGKGANAEFDIDLNPVLQITPIIRNRTIRDYQGYLVNRARVLDAPVQYLDVTAVGTSCTFDDWCTLMEYLKSASRLWVYEKNTGFTSTDNYPFPNYLCRLVDTDYVGSIGKNARRSFRLRFEVEEQKAMIGAT